MTQIKFWPGAATAKLFLCTAKKKFLFAKQRIGATSSSTTAHGQSLLLDSYLVKKILSSDHPEVIGIMVKLQNTDILQNKSCFLISIINIDILKQKIIFNISVKHGRDITKSGLQPLVATW
jgi:hypothetical protein